MRGLFITGSDTGVGKTLVTCAIARTWRREGRDFRVCKPVATGADGPIAEDARLLAEAAGDDPASVTSFVFAEAAAPPVAARAAGRTLTLDDLHDAVCRRANGAAVLVEGVGGLLCPLTEKHTVADLVARLGLPLVVVVRRSLGTLNHTLLTLEVARQRGLVVVAVVVNETVHVSTLAERTNPDELRKRIDVPLLVTPFLGTEVASREIEAIRDLDWWSLLR